MPENTTQGLTWRAATDADKPLLLALFVADRRADFAPLGLSEQQLAPLLDMQFRGRDLTYAQKYPAATDIILCLADGTPVGRHLVERQPEAYRSIDLAVLPEFQRRGIGAWALGQIQRLAEIEGVVFDLRVVKSNPAVRLYERLGFRKRSEDEISWEMRWEPETLRRRAAAAAPPPHDVPSLTDGAFTRDGVIDRIAAFLRELGLTVDFAPVPTDSLLPGLHLIPNGLRVDRDALLFPGDMLHEAGHLAVMSPELRARATHSPTGPADEMGAIAWSWAAAQHLGIPPVLVIHDNGYKGAAAALRSEFASGRGNGIPYLAWLGLTTQPTPGNPSIFPRMLHWLRPSGNIPEEP
jgi:GNAT superfamily N-acetyltransferase